MAYKKLPKEEQKEIIKEVLVNSMGDVVEEVVEKKIVVKKEKFHIFNDRAALVDYTENEEQAVELAKNYNGFYKKI